MQTNQEVFLLVAQELSISRAAERAYITQQCASDHIKRLEQQYQVKLFERRPRFRLTDAGQILYNALNNITAIERGVQQSLTGLADNGSGHFVLGISTSRAQVILPWVLPEFYQHFPEVTIHFSMEDTSVLEERLLDGSIDLLLGVNTSANDSFSYNHLAKDDIYLIMSNRLLHQHFPDNIGKVLTGDVRLDWFQSVPIIGAYNTSAITDILRQHQRDYRVQLHPKCYISDTSTQISLCAKHLGAGFISKMLIDHIKHWNLNCEWDEYLHVMPIAGLRDVISLDLVSLKNVHKPIFVQYFEKICVNAIKEHFV